MKKISVNRMRFGWLVLAYLALLAHAFVPHHHHADHTAHLNSTECVEHTHSQETEAPAESAECITLNHALINAHSEQADFSISSDDFVFLQVQPLLCNFDLATAPPTFTLRASDRDMQKISPLDFQRRGPPILTSLYA